MNNFKSYLTVILLLSIMPLSGFSQEISRSVITFGGSEYGAENGLTLDATLGQIAIHELTGPYVLTQGFQQGDLADVVYPATPDIEASIFPNPFEDELQINILLYSEIEIRVYNVLGQLIYTTMPQTEEMVIQTTDWHTGVYFINFSAGGKRLFTEKVIKHTSK
jgi:hypothetical protein